MDPTAAQIIGSIISGVIGAGIAWFTIWLQRKETLGSEQRAKAQQADLLRSCLAAELETLAEGIKVVLDKSADLDDPKAAMSTIGTLRVRIYPGVAHQLGLLGSDLAGGVVSQYAVIEHLIDRGLEIEERRHNVLDATVDDDAAAWFAVAIGLHTELREMVAALQSPSQIAQREINGVRLDRGSSAGL